MGEYRLTVSRPSAPVVLCTRPLSSYSVFVSESLVPALATRLRRTVTASLAFRKFRSSSTPIRIDTFFARTVPTDRPTLSYTVLVASVLASVSSCVTTPVPGSTVVEEANRSVAHSTRPIASYVVRVSVPSGYSVRTRFPRPS